MSKILLSEIKEGALQERFEMSLKKVLNNIADPNTEAQKKRTIVIKLEFEPDQLREETNLTFEVTEKMAPAYKLSTKILTDGSDAAEIGRSAPGQRKFDTVTGEILDTPRIEQGKLQVIGR